MEGMRNILAGVELVKKIKPEIIFLQETWLRSFNVSQLSEVMMGFKWFAKTADSGMLIEDRLAATNLSYHGVAIGVDLGISESITEIEIPNKNIIAVIYKTKTEKILLANIYLPTQGKATTRRATGDGTRQSHQEICLQKTDEAVQSSENPEHGSETRPCNIKLTEMLPRDNRSGMSGLVGLVGTGPCAECSLLF